MSNKLNKDIKPFNGQLRLDEQLSTYTSTYTYDDAWDEEYRSHHDYSPKLHQKFAGEFDDPAKVLRQRSIDFDRPSLA